MVTSKNKMILAELANLLGGTVEGDSETMVNGVCSLDNPVGGYIAFAEKPEKINWNTGIERPAALIVGEQVDIEGLPLLIHNNPRLAFTYALRHFYSDDEFSGSIHPGAIISPDARVDESAWIGPFVVVDSKAEIGFGVRIGAGCYIGERSVIGEKTILHPNVTILRDVTVGRRCIFQSGAVIGSDGFGYTPTPEGNIKVPQVGGIRIGDDVEIGANATIDRATLDMTVITNDVKIDNLVQIAHNVSIGEHTRIAAQVGIPGRVTVKNDVVIGGQAGFQNGIVVGEGSRIAGRSGVTKSVPDHCMVSGYPADDHKKALQLLALQKRLPDIMKRLKKIEKQLESESD